MKNKYKIGLIGLGSLGQHIAKRLLIEFNTLFVYDIDSNKMDMLCKDGAYKIENYEQSLILCDFLLLALPSPSSILEVVNKIFVHRNNYNSKKYIIDLSTNSPAMVNKLYRFCKKRNCVYIDSPLTGGVMGAKHGTMTAMIGAEKDVIPIIKPILKSFCKVIVNVGQSGHGSMTKLLHNMLGEIQVYGIAEAFCFAESLGIDLDKFYEVLSNGMATSKILTELYANGALIDNYEAQASVLTAEKDQRLLLEFAKSKGVKLTFSNIVYAQILKLLKKDLGGDDVTSAVKIYENYYGVKIKKLNIVKSK
ncbi:NAD(P)-dependent oxidoreductase [Clostridium sp.]|uniref:NAD(P)-dependent oxidoreductase n=1 Tax=Clostridium sp. TaxID=1506 RepID=UPI002850E254|nr:NAD(P)-dependent oxidoreductase [Clostridium sp.]MDR3596500.1 NAD(P)-dependent oxidoreductase [Clostridium sp.]